MLTLSEGPQDLSSALGAAIAQQAKGDIQPAFKIVSELAGRDNLTCILQQLVADPLWLQQVADRSYYHPNNFVKIVLLQGAQPDWKLRLHVWWPAADTDPKAEDIHSHRWDFTTAIVTGEYQATEFTTGPGLEHYHYEYQLAGDLRSFRMKLLGKASLAPVFQARLPTGTVYHISHKVLHRVSSARSSLTATLMMQGPPRRTCTDVFSANQVGHQPESEIPLRRLEAPTLRSQLMKFQECLDHKQGQ